MNDYYDYQKGECGTIWLPIVYVPIELQQRNNTTPNTMECFENEQVINVVQSDEELEVDVESDHDEKPKVEKVQEKIDENVFKRQRKVLLGKLSNDLDYLEHLVNDVKIGEIHEHDKRGRIIRSEAQDAINFLEGRQEFWSQYKPMYSK